MRSILTGAALAALLVACSDNSETGTEQRSAQNEAFSEIEASGSGEGQPVRWVVRDEDSALVLFPTVHILPADLEWRSQEFDATLEAADEVWFEVEPAEMNDQARMQELSIRYGFDQETPLSEKLDDETYQELSRIATELGLPPQQLEPMRPWLVGLTLQVMDLMRDGFDPNAGVEKVLAQDVPDEKERGLETIEEQLGFFAQMPLDVQKDFLKATLEEIEQGQNEMRNMAESWARGDLSSLERMMLEDMREVSEELYQVLLVERNKRWVDQLTKELEGSGVDVVAVGAGHLVGEDGVPALLAAKGYEVEGPLPE